ncbi:oligopeptide/dipeptide ABC transporter, ATP-binding protein [Burkholderiales bacterium JOSHI_001]|nr:oligopeptide/dipeptide ABC transporter, ATP-binding protein [Burkholderiales bacterium JOSHI_001]
MHPADTAAPAPPLLAVRQLRVSLPGPQGAPLAALRGVDFELHRGQVLGLIGESGCGKSLTALALMGLLPDDSVVTGSIRLAGRELLGLPERDWCALRGDRLGMVFQEPMTALNPLQKIGDQVAEPLRQHQGLNRTQAREAALQLLQRVQLPQAAQRLDAWPHQLSGGQRQRVVIAMALACKPDLLVADEPTTALDATLQREVLQLMAELVREDGMALLLISHDLALVAQRVQRLLVMYAGQVVESGPAAQVLRHGAHPYTRALLAARPLLGMARGTRLATIPGRVPALADMPAGCAFAARCPRAEADCRAAPPALAALGANHSVRCIHPHAEAATA